MSPDPEAPSPILFADIFPEGLVITFDNGKSALYDTALLHRMFGEAALNPVPYDEYFDSPYSGGEVDGTIDSSDEPPVSG